MRAQDARRAALCHARLAANNYTRRSMIFRLKLSGTIAF